MPPETPPVEPPVGRGTDVAPYLASFGIVDHIPSIRSSDDGIIARDPFTYYLTRRLALVPALSLDASDALSIGSYTHLLYETEGEHQEILYNEALDNRLAEVKKLSKALGEDPTYHLNAEKSRSVTAKALYKASQRYTTCFDGSTFETLPTYINRNYRTLAVEQLLSYRDPDFSRTVLTAQIDRLLYHEDTDTLWILDYKTTGRKPKDRAADCEYEYQARHYCYILEKSLPHLRRQYNLPSSTKAGGILHAIIYKPKITYGENDRPYIWSAVGKRSKVSGRAIPIRDEYGSITKFIAETMQEVAPFSQEKKEFHQEDKAVEWLHAQCQKKPAKLYEGTPDPKLYESRVYQKYEQALDEIEGPPICIHTSPFNAVLDEDGLQEYLLQTRTIYHYATCRPCPVSFPRRWASDAYYPFFVLHPKDWPAAITKLNFVQSPRDRQNDETP